MKILLVAVSWLCVFVGRDLAYASASRPDVLFIAVDDLNDLVLTRDGRSLTPNLMRLASRGVLFTHAYCESPACNPSRTALLTGMRCTTTGVYGNKSDWRAALPDAITLPQHFAAHGYRTLGAGKIFHHHFDNAFHDDRSFDAFLKLQPDPMPAAKLNGLSAIGANFDWGPTTADVSKLPDVQSVDWTIDVLARKPVSSPMFLAVGLFRPHMPFFAPPAYFDRTRSDEVLMPVILEDDLADVPSGGDKVWSETRRFFDAIYAADQQKPGTWREAVRSYQACVRFMDDELGRLLDAWERSPCAERGIVVLWSDHGYHLGEKKHWEKFALWEKTTHVPLVIVAPEIASAGTICDAPVSLLDVYPTLAELCGLSARTELEGVSLVPLVRDPKSSWERPAVMSYMPGNHAVRSRRWRYIRYADGSEELYDHASDGNEWHNLAADAQHASIIAEHRRWLPQVNARPVADMRDPSGKK